MLQHYRKLLNLYLLFAKDFLLYDEYKIGNSYSKYIKSIIKRNDTMGKKIRY